MQIEQNFANLKRAQTSRNKHICSLLPVGVAQPDHDHQRSADSANPDATGRAPSMFDMPRCLRDPALAAIHRTCAIQVGQQTYSRPGSEKNDPFHGSHILKAPRTALPGYNYPLKADYPANAGSSR
jgi:hypothetical protein